MHRSTTALLRELDRLPHQQRMALLVARARESIGTGRLAELLIDLRAGTPYERFLALMAGTVVGDRAAVLAALDDPYAPIRAVAVKQGLRAGWLAPEQTVALVADAPADLRRVVYRTVRGQRLSVVADGLIDAVRERFGAAEAAKLLPACGAGTVRRLLPLVEHAVNSWPLLARRHPEAVLDLIESTLDALPIRDRASWWAPRARGILVAAERQPDRVLDLLERYAPNDRLPGDPAGYGVLAAAAPTRIVRLLTAPDRADWLVRARLPTALLDRLGRLDTAELVPLGRRLRGNDHRFAALLDALPPGRRTTLYDAVLADVDTSALEPADELLRVLPRQVREREASRLLGLARIQASEPAVLRWTAQLPWARARPALAAALRAADAQERGIAYALLLAAARHSGDPAVVADALTLLGRLRNEQDPVRISALNGLPPLARLLRPDTVDTLAQLVTDAVQARDSSTGTLAALGRLATRVLRHHYADPILLGWALQTLDRLFEGHSQPPLGRLDQELRRGQESVVFARLRPWLEAAVARGRYAPLFAVATALGRRAHRLPELQDLLGRAIDRRNPSNVVREAVHLWLDDPTHRAERVERVLDVDSSTITIWSVWDVVCARRTDLLDRVLTGRGPKGAFLAGGIRWVPGPARYVDRWLPRQQDAYVRLQAKVAADAGAVVHSRVAAIAHAARVPGGGALAMRYLDSPNVTLAEAALGALPWSDRPDEALPLLLAHADDDRARVALYAAGRAARFVRPSRLLTDLSGIALGRGKVTSRKESLRLLARFGPPEAMELLLRAWQQPDQHRDVRAAIVSAARQRPYAPASWTILEHAVGSGREEALALLAAPPGTVAEPDRPRYAALIVEACRSSDQVLAREAWSHLSWWRRWAPDVTGLATATLSNLDVQHGRQVLEVVVGALLDHPPSPDGGPLEAALTELVRLDGADHDPGGPAGDRPARRRIGEIMDAAQVWATAQRHAGSNPEPARRTARHLGREHRFVPQAAELLTALVRPDSPAAELVADLTLIAELVEGRPVLAARLAERLGSRVSASANSLDPATLITAARTLAGRGDATGGLFALALSSPGQSYGWSPPWRDLLRELREHPAPDVRDAALAIPMAPD